MEKAVNQVFKPLSGFDLTTLLIRGGLGQLDLKANSKLVMLYFATCYNFKKGKVFPKIKTIADAMGISEIGVKRAVAELVEKGYILKTKKGLNANQYIITNKVTKYHDDTTQRYHSDTSNKQDDTSQGITVILPCHEIKQHEVKETNNKEVVDLKEIPAIILNNPDILNKQAYWRKLSDDVKKEYIEKQEALERQEEYLKQKNSEWKQTMDEIEKIKKEPPFYTTLSEREALSFIEKMKRIDIKLLNGVIGQYLIKKFGFTL